ncbi:MAG: hypothetical protein Ct9H90mP16_07840 [Candidatus Poseidoniales archaeon]|nr:MAG: hypothetical protein Ct9H90mP16_07840 [Candidatus Poseidoniales archaeon]
MIPLEHATHQGWLGWWDLKGQWSTTGPFSEGHKVTEIPTNRALQMRSPSQYPNMTDFIEIPHRLNAIQSLDWWAQSPPTHLSGSHQRPQHRLCWPRGFPVVSELRTDPEPSSHSTTADVTGFTFTTNVKGMDVGASS